MRIARVKHPDPNRMPARLTVAAGSWRYIGEMAWKIAVWSRPAANPTTAIPATRHQGENGGETIARYRNAAPASPHARASVQPTPLRRSRADEIRADPTRPEIRPA